MATKMKTAHVDLNSVFEGAASQFRGLNPNEPGQWPMLPKALTFVAVALVVVVAGWFAPGVLSSAHDELDTERNKEPTLKADYRNKLAQAVNLGELRKQKLQVEDMALVGGAALGLSNPCEGRGGVCWRSSANTDSHQPSSMTGIAL